MKHYTILALLLLFLSPLVAQEWERQHPFDDLRDALDVGMAPNGFGVLVGQDGLLMQTSDFGENWTYPDGTFSGILREASCTPNGDGTYTTWVAGTDLWRSPDEGQSWEQVAYPEGFGNATFLNVLQPGELIVGNASALFKTDNQGTDWENITPDNLGFITNFFFLDSMHGWIGNRDGQVFITQDGGQSWEQATIADGLEEFVEPLFIDELNGYASLREDFYRTTDGGYTWEKIADNAFGNYTEDMAFSDETGQSIVATSFDRRIYQSVDGGLTWAKITPGDGFVNGLEALPDGQVWVTSDFRSVYYSPSSGMPYENQIPGIRESLEDVDFLDLNTGWAVGGNAVLKTTDGGDNWEAINIADFTSAGSLRQVLVLSQQEVWLLDNDEIIRTVDGGTSWEVVFEIPESFFSYGLEKAGNNIMAASNNGFVYRTEDEGATWESIAIEGIDRLRTLTFAGDEVGYAVGSQSNLAKTTDGGATWFELSSDLPGGLNLLHTAFINPDTGWIVNRDLSDHIWKTEDGGTSWISSTVSANTYWQGITFVNDSTGYIYGGSSIVGKVFETTDGGSTWSEAHAINIQINDTEIVTDGTTKRIWVAGLGGNIERQESDLISSTQQINLRSLEIAPNPTNGLLQLQLPDQLPPSARIEVYNAAGQIVLRQPATPRINTEAWAPGIYLLRLVNGPYIYQAKVVKAGNP